MSVDGKRVGDDLFAPGWTNYRDQVQYQSYDVTGLLARGANAMAAQLAPGWYAGDVGWFGTGQYGTTPALWAQLQVTYTDGSVEFVDTDPSWQGSTDGPVTSADNYMGSPTTPARTSQAGPNPASAARMVRMARAVRLARVGRRWTSSRARRRRSCRRSARRCG